MTIALLVAPPLDAQTRVVPYAGLSPGMSTKAEVDLSLGDPRGRVGSAEHTYEYTPPRGADDTEKVVIEYWPDTVQIARIDVYPKVAPASAPIRQQFGTRVVARERADGRREEIFYPSMLGMILTGKDADAPVAAVSYLSTRSVAAVYAIRAYEALAAERLLDARTEAEKAILIDPDYGNGYVALGQYFEEAGDPHEALARFTLATRARYGPYHRAGGHAGLGRLYEGPLKSPEKARAEFDQAIAVATARYRDIARVWLAEYLQRQKKQDEALTEFRRALAENPTNRQAQRGAAAILYDKDAYREAIPLFASLSEWAQTDNPPDKASIFGRYAYSLGETDQRREAISWYHKALEAGYEPKSVILNSLAYQHRKLGEPQKALEYVDEGLKLTPKDSYLLVNRTNALLELRRFADALTQAQATLASDPKSGLRMLDVARAYGGLKKRRETLQWATKAIEAGVRDERALTSDPLLALIQKDSKYRRLISSLQ